MANETINVTYSGKSANEYISRAVLGAKSIEGGYVTPKVDVSVPTKISILETNADLLQAYSADFIAKGGYSLSERILTPKLLMVNMNLDKKKLLATYESEKMSAGAMGKTFPADFMSYLTGKINQSVNNQIEANLWNGTYNAADGALQKFDGFLTLSAASGSGTVKVNKTGAAAFTSANIRASLNEAYNSLGAEVTEAEDFKLYVSPATAKIYRTTLTDYQNQSTVGKKPLDFEGVEIVPTAGITGNNTIVGSRVSNLLFGTDLLSDLNQIAIKDMFDSDLTQNIRIRMEMFACAQFAFGEEFLVYKTAA